MADIYSRMDDAEEAIQNLEQEVDNLTLTDSGWIDLPLVAGILAYNDSLKPKYRKIGNQIFLSGVVKNISQANTILATLPEGCRPVRQHYFTAGSATLANGEASFYNCQVNADGNIRITTHSAGTYNDHYLRLSTSFLID